MNVRAETERTKVINLIENKTLKFTRVSSFESHFKESSTGDLYPTHWGFTVSHPVQSFWLITMPGPLIRTGSRIYVVNSKDSS